MISVMTEKLYVNENFPFPVVQFLREKGIDIVISFEVGNANKSIPDVDVLNYAIKTERIVLTLNRRDFIKLHHLDADHYGIIVSSEYKNFFLHAEKINDLLIKNEGNFKSKLTRLYQ